MYLKARELANEESVLELEQLFSIRPKDPEEKISEVLGIYRDSGAAQATRQAISDYTQRAYEVLRKMELATGFEEVLRKFAENLMDRNV